MLFRQSGQMLVLALVCMQVALAGERPKPPDKTDGVAAAADVCTDLEGKVEPCPAVPVRTVQPEPERPVAGGFRSLPGNILYDQAAFWTTPARMRTKDLNWLLPLGSVTAISLASDTDIESHLPTNPTTIQHAKSFSDYGAAAFVGVAGGAFLWGQITHNDHMSETGFLSGEALADSFLVTTALKYATGRERPTEGDYKGHFWQGGDSFPSEHAAAAWSVASVLAHEYPGPLTKLLAYGGAAGVSAARVIGDKHFASDALIGSVLGWYIGRQVYRAHRADPDITRMWGTFDKAPAEGGGHPGSLGSPYVPMDSWVYAAFDRLSALGYVQTGLVGLRPWTRSECARLLSEAADLRDGDSFDSQAGPLLEALRGEFAAELQGASRYQVRIDSIYGRFTGISGTPVTDGYHFGQTLSNDFGRPYYRGGNFIGGADTDATAGPLVFYLRGEYQRAPSIPALPLQARQAIATADNIPLPAATVNPAVSRFELLDAYVGLRLQNTQITFGRQTLWWSPNDSGALMFSDNSRPITMVRIDQVSPFTLPGPLARLGPWRHQIFFGQLAGHSFPAHPYIYGQKLSFKPTPNLELGISRMTVLGGEGNPLTLRSFWRSFTSVSDAGLGPNLVRRVADLGDRRGGFDVSYRVPGLRKWLVLNVDSLVDDDPSPLAAPRRAAIAPGFYMPHVPGIPKLDLRVEAAYTDVPSGRSVSGQFIYWNSVFKDSHTEDGNLFGHWVGREGQAYNATSTYWLSPRNTLAFGYRNARVDNDFIPGGVTLHDASLRTSFLLRQELSLNAGVQYEHLNVPVLSIFQQSNVAASLQLTYWPKWGLRKSK